MEYGPQTGFVAHLKNLEIEDCFLNFREKLEKKVLFWKKSRKTQGKLKALRVCISKSCFMNALLLSVLSWYLCFQC